MSSDLFASLCSHANWTFICLQKFVVTAVGASTTVICIVQSLTNALKQGLQDCNRLNTDDKISESYSNPVM